MELQSITFPGLPDPYKVAPASHLEDKNNPHGVTPEQIGAHPNTWMPTAAQVGAAQAGFGLGEIEAPIITSDEQLDSTVKSGFYRISIAGKAWGNTGITANGGAMIVSGIIENRTNQIVFIQNSNTILARYMYNGSWAGWVNCSPSAFAPSGFGLGSVAGADKWNGDANALTKQGWYRLESGTTNGVGASASVRVDGYAETGLTQTAYTRTGFVLQRTCVDGTWGEWEYVNPPMQVGTEYRTTERCDGKVVYAKRINCYAAPASVDISDLGIDTVVRWNGWVSYYGVALPCSSTNWKVDVNRTTISTTSAYDQASAHFYIILYYTKS